MMKKTKMGKLFALICTALACVMVFSLAACNNGGDKDELKLSATTAQVEVGKTTTIQVDSATTDTIEWSSDKTNIATVKGSGTGNKLCTITGEAEGTATVTAKAGDKTATCTVTVKPAQSVVPDVETVTIKRGDVEVSTAVQNLYGAGDTLTLTATASKGSAITWETSAPAVATVDGGVVTAVAAGDAVITAKVSNDIKATVNVKVVTASTEVVYGTENGYVSGWRYWTGDSDNASVTSCLNYGADAAKITYSLTSGQAHSVQLFYKDKYAGTDHDINLIVVAPKDGDITVNGDKQELKAGENKVSVPHFSGSNLTVQFGVGGEGGSIFTGTDLEFLLKDIVYKCYADTELKAPTFTLDSDNVITITDTENDSTKVEKYELGMFANENDEVPAYTLKAVNGKAVNFVKAPTGNYYLKLRALNNTADNGNMIVNSAWSTATAFNWTNDKTLLEYKANDQIAAGSNTWYCWYRNWDPVVQHEGVYIEGNTIYIKELETGKAENWDFQLFYKGTEGKKFNITVTCSNAGNITVNGDDVKELTANTAVTFENKEAVGISIQLGGGAAANNLSGDVTLVIEEVPAAPAD